MTANHKGKHSGINEAYANRATLTEIDSMPLSCNTRDAARILGISATQTQRLAKSGRLPCCRIGGQWRFSTARLVAMINGEDVLRGTFSR